MSQTPQGNAPQNAPTGSNGLGIAGFIISLVAICTGFLLSPIALLLSVIALFKRPKGFAVAGTIIGGLGSLVLVVTAVFLISFGSQMLALGMKGFKAWQTLQQGDARVQQARQDEGELPSTEAGTELVEDLKDPWGQSLRYKRKNNDYRVLSAGPDQQFGTGDDLRFKLGTVHVGSDSSFGQGSAGQNQP
jgi:hypothetical protein